MLSRETAFNSIQAVKSGCNIVLGHNVYFNDVPVEVRQTAPHDAPFNVVPGVRNSLL